MNERLDHVRRRRSIRMPSYDYSSPGAYFVTICCQEHEPIFGYVSNENMVLSVIGQIVAESWSWLANKYSWLSVDTTIVMPNHTHGIIIIDGPAPPTAAVKRKPLGGFVGAFKTVAAKRINRLRHAPAAPLWQRGYYEHVVRDEEDLERIRQYIVENPAAWQYDRESPEYKGGDALDEYLRARGRQPVNQRRPSGQRRAAHEPPLLAAVALFRRGGS